MANVDLSAADVPALVADVEKALEGLNTVLSVVDKLPFLGQYAALFGEVQTVLSFVEGVLAKL